MAYYQTENWFLRCMIELSPAISKFAKLNIRSVKHAPLPEVTANTKEATPVQTRVPGIDIPAETIRQFVTEYLSDNGWHNRILENLASTSAFDSLEFLIFGEVDCHIFPILGPQRPPSGGAALVLLIPLGSGVEGPLIPLILVPLLSLVVGVEVSLIPL